MAFRFSDGGGLEQIGELAAGYAIGGATGAALEPLLQSLRNRLFSLDPSVPTPAATLARLLLLGLVERGAAQGEAAKSGVGADALDDELAALRTVPGTDALLELSRRGKLEIGDLEAALLRGGLDDRYLAAYLELARNLPGVADLAMWRQQEFIDDATLEARAAEAGFSADDAELYYKAAGLPPGTDVGLELLRRGKIDRARFAEYVAEGHTKTKYTDDLLELVTVPLSAAIAAELLIRERISQERAVAIAAENGIAEADFLTWASGLGRPIAVGEALTVIRRGLKGPIDGPEARAYFEEVVARSDTRTEYAGDLLELATVYPSLFQVQRALANGTATATLASSTLKKEGYPEEWVEAIVGAHPGSAKAKTKQLTAAIVDTLYEAGLSSHPEAEKALEALGYTQADADNYLEVWAARRVVGELVHGLSLIRGRYVGWKIDRPTTVNLLDALTGDGTVKERLLPLWDDEREANAPVLTGAEIGQAYKYGRYSYDQAIEAWQKIGYTLDDAVTRAWIVARGDPTAAGA